jgi:hypothetical protein
MTAFDLSVTWDPSQMEIVDYSNYACDRDWIGKEKIDEDSYCLLASKLSNEAAWSSDAIWVTLTFHCLGWGTSEITVESSSLGSIWIWDGDPLGIPYATHPEPFGIICSQLRPFPPGSTVVGGVTIPTDKVSILMPYLALVGLLGLMVTVLVTRKRSKN